MTAGPATAVANGILDAIGNATAFTTFTPYMKLHIGDPGSAGTANAAGNTTRKLISFGAAAAGSIANDAALNWTAGEVTTTEDYTFWSMWDAATAGNFKHSGTVTANGVTAGDVFNIAIGAFTLTVSPVAT